MQIVCETCGTQSDGSAIEVVDGQVRATCGHCGTVSLLGGGAASPAPVASPAAAATGRPEPGGSSARQMPDPLLEEPRMERPPSRAAVPAMQPAEDGTIKCPKCANRQRSRTSCHKCGLVFANVRNGATPWERWPPEKQPAIRQAKKLWAAVEASPHLANCHAEFVAFCKAQAVADFAAMRYRHFVADHPEEPLAKQYLEESVKNAHALAAMMLNAGQKGGAPEQVKRLRLWVGAAVMIVTITLFVFAVRFYFASAGLR